MYYIKQTLLLIPCFFTILGGYCLLIEFFTFLDYQACIPSRKLSLIIVFCLSGIYWFFNKRHKSRIELKVNANRTKISIYFGDLFTQQGWKVIAVNEYFDHLVDDIHVARKSLHGKVLQLYWAGNSEQWYASIIKTLKEDSIHGSPEKRQNGNNPKFPIGTTATLKIQNDKFLFFVLSNTNPQNCEAKASFHSLCQAIQACLDKARSVCAGIPLNIPLIGAGLSRTGLSYYMLINIILSIVIECSQQNGITSQINIVLPKHLRQEIDLNIIKQSWR